MISLDSKQPSSESDVDVDIEHHTVFDEPSYSKIPNTGIIKREHSKCYHCGLCIICLCLTLIGMIGAILIYLAVQSEQQISPIHPPSTSVEMQLQIITNSSIGQLAHHQSKITSMIQQSANQILDDMIINVASIQFMDSDFAFIGPESRRRLSQTSNIIADVTIDIAIPNTDPLDANQFDHFNWTNTVLSALQDQNGTFLLSLQEQLTNTNLNIQSISVKQISQQYVVMMSANFEFDNFVEEGIFVQLLSSEKQWALNHAKIESHQYETTPFDIWYVNTFCGSRGGVSYSISHHNSTLSLKDILCSVHHEIINNLGQAANLINDEIRQSSLRINQPSDIRVCGIFNGIIDACAVQQSNTKYICVNRDGSDDIDGFNCPL